MVNIEHCPAFSIRKSRSAGFDATTAGLPIEAPNRYFSKAMPALTRRRSPDAQQETWLVYYGDTMSAPSLGALV